jgi:hypothetical protein
MEKNENMKMIITTADESVTVCTEIQKSDLNKDSFDVISPDFMIRVEAIGDKWEVINAVDGWGNNCRELFKDALVKFV